MAIRPSALFEHLSEDQVCDWIREVFPQYYDNFRSNHVDGFTLSRLDMQKLKEDIGIESLGHRKELMWLLYPGDAPAEAPYRGRRKRTGGATANGLVDESHHEGKKGADDSGPVLNTKRLNPIKTTTSISHNNTPVTASPSPLTRETLERSIFRHRSRSPLSRLGSSISFMSNWGAPGTPRSVEDDELDPRRGYKDIPSNAVEELRDVIGTHFDGRYHPSHIDHLRRHFIRSFVPTVQTSVDYHEDTNSDPSWQTMRVYVCSTFPDFANERKALQREVFPLVRCMCDGRRVSLHVIDLSFGCGDDQSSISETTLYALNNLFLHPSQERTLSVAICLLGSSVGQRASRTEARGREISLFEIEVENILKSAASNSGNDMFHVECLFFRRSPNFATQNQDFLQCPVRAQSDYGLIPREAVEGDLKDKHAKYDQWASERNGMKKVVEDISLDFPIEEYECKFSSFEGDDNSGGEGVKLEHFEQFCGKTYHQLAHLVHWFFPPYEPSPMREFESSFHQLRNSLAVNLGGKYSGRENVIRDIEENILEGRHTLQVLEGESGSGLTATMLALTKRMLSFTESTSYWSVLTAFLDSTRGQLSFTAYLMRKIAAVLGVNYSPSVNKRESVQLMSRWFEHHDSTLRFLVLVDNPTLDTWSFIEDVVQEPNIARSVQWVVAFGNSVSTSPSDQSFGGAGGSALLQRLQRVKAHVVHIDALRTSERQKVLSAWYKEHNSGKLSFDKVRTIQGQKDGGKPLFLKCVATSILSIITRNPQEAMPSCLDDVFALLVKECEKQPNSKAILTVLAAVGDYGLPVTTLSELTNTSAGHVMTLLRVAGKGFVEYFSEGDLSVVIRNDGLRQKLCVVYEVTSLSNVALGAHLSGRPQPSDVETYSRMVETLSSHISHGDAARSEFRMLPIAQCALLWASDGSADEDATNETVFIESLCSLHYIGERLVKFPELSEVLQCYSVVARTLDVPNISSARLNAGDKSRKDIVLTIAEFHRFLESSYGVLQRSPGQIYELGMLSSVDVIKKHVDMELEVVSSFIRTSAAQLQQLRKEASEGSMKAMHIIEDGLRRLSRWEALGIDKISDRAAFNGVKGLLKELSAVVVAYYDEDRDVATPQRNVLQRFASTLQDEPPTDVDSSEDEGEHGDLHGDGDGDGQAAPPAIQVTSPKPSPLQSVASTDRHGNGSDSDSIDDETMRHDGSDDSSQEATPRVEQQQRRASLTPVGSPVPSPSASPRPASPSHNSNSLRQLSPTPSPRQSPSPSPRTATRESVKLVSPHSRPLKLTGPPPAIEPKTVSENPLKPKGKLSASNVFSPKRSSSPPFQTSPEKTNAETTSSNGNRSNNLRGVASAESKPAIVSPKMDLLSRDNRGHKDPVESNATANGGKVTNTAPTESDYDDSFSDLDDITEPETPRSTKPSDSKPTNATSAVGSKPSVAAVPKTSYDSESDFEESEKSGANSAHGKVTVTVTPSANVSTKVAENDQNEYDDNYSSDFSSELDEMSDSDMSV